MFLEEVDSDYGETIYHNEIMSSQVFLNSFCLLSAIKLFMEKKGKKNIEELNDKG